MLFYSWKKICRSFWPSSAAAVTVTVTVTGFICMVSSSCPKATYGRDYLLFTVKIALKIQQRIGVLKGSRLPNKRTEGAQFSGDS